MRDYFKDFENRKNLLIKININLPFKFNKSVSQKFTYA